MKFNIYLFCIFLGMVMAGCGSIEKKSKWVIEPSNNMYANENILDESVAVDFKELSMRSVCQFLSKRFSVGIEVEANENTYYAPLINIRTGKMKLRDFLDKITKMTNTKWSVAKNNIHIKEIDVIHSEPRNFNVDKLELHIKNKLPENTWISRWWDEPITTPIKPDHIQNKIDTTYKVRLSLKELMYYLELCKINIHRGDLEKALINSENAKNLSTLVPHKPIGTKVKDIHISGVEKLYEIVKKLRKVMDKEAK